MSTVWVSLIGSARLSFLVHRGVESKEEERLLIRRIKKWRHLFKLDPNRALSDLALQHICLSNTDAIVIGGTDGITFDNTFRLLQRVKKYKKYCVQEVSSVGAIVPGFDGYLIPVVLNTNEAKWFKGAHVEALKKYGHLVPWDQVVLEAYVSLNPDAKVSRLTKAMTNLQKSDLIAYLQLTDRLFRLPIFYMEYSGTYGDVEKVKAVSQEITYSRLFYGGGLFYPTQVKEMARWADTIVVGNLIYTNVDRAIQTVAWVKETERRQKKK